jgi:hypothetical protein
MKASILEKVSEKGWQDIVKGAHRVSSSFYLAIAAVQSVHVPTSYCSSVGNMVGLFRRDLADSAVVFDCMDEHINKNLYSTYSYI